MMLTLAQAYQRARWYTWIARLISAVWVMFLLISLLKTVFAATLNYTTWPYPLSLAKWAIQRAAVFVYDLPGGSVLWNGIEPIDLPAWLIRPEVAVLFFFLVVGGLMRRAALELRKGLQEALYAAQLAHWQRELMGEKPTREQVALTQIGVQVNLYQQLPAPPTPWWTRPWGLLLIAIIGGIASAVIAQWLNIQLGLVSAP